MIGESTTFFDLHTNFDIHSSEDYLSAEIFMSGRRRSDYGHDAKQVFVVAAEDVR